MPSQLDAKIYSLIFLIFFELLLFTCGVLVVSASSQRHRVGPFPFGRWPNNCVGVPKMTKVFKTFVGANMVLVPDCCPNWTTFSVSKSYFSIL